MAKLKNIIKQLSESDFQAIYDSLLSSNAEKSAYLMKSLREQNLSDSKIMVELDVNANAYYTLRSRLNQKIEEHLLGQMESPRHDILKKVGNISEMLFTKKRTISIATLKKIERELLDYDLANELTQIYKNLRKLHVHTPEHFTYSQLYNRHIAYMLAMDKAENLLAEYFKRYGNYFFTASEQDKLALTLQLREMQSVARLYQSHRLYVYLSCISIFHQLFVESDQTPGDVTEPVEDIFAAVRKIFDSYPMDPQYYHLKMVFEFLRLEYYNHYRVFKQAEKYYEEINEAATSLLMNYVHYTFPPQFLVSRMLRSLRLGIEVELFGENENLFRDLELDPADLVATTVYDVYRGLSSFYVGKYDEAARILNQLLNHSGLRNFPFIWMEIKTLLALQYCLLNDGELFNQLSNSIQRQLRLTDKESCQNLVLILKMLRTALSESSRDKEARISQLARRIGDLPLSPYFSPTSFIRMDGKFVKQLAACNPYIGS